MKRVLPPVILGSLALGGAAAFVAWLISQRQKVTEILAQSSDQIRTVIGYVAGKAVNLQVTDIGDGFLLRLDAARAWKNLVAAALADGIVIKLNSAFRTTQDQVRMTQERAEFAAPVNYSPHQAAYAVDIETAKGTNAAYAWMVRNAHRFGFKAHAELYPRATVKEPWHWEYRA